MVNEYFVLLSAYLMIFFSDYCWDSDVTEYAGIAFTILIVLTVLFNIIILLVVTIKECVYKAKLRKYRKASRKRIG